VQAAPVEAEVWLQMMFDAETKVMAPHAETEQSRVRARTRRFNLNFLFLHQLFGAFNCSVHQVNCQLKENCNGNG
jgi:hypothetical protein